MSIANLANIPGDEPSLLNWTFAHMDHHRQISAAIQRNTGQILPIFPIDPITPTNMGVFLYQHAQMHQQQNAVLGINGLNLLDVDWRDEAQRATWIFQNFTEHLRASNLLGIG